MNRSHSMVGLVLIAAIGSPQDAIAQITSDGSLTTPTIVSPNMNGKDFLIDAGTRSGNNLFHSFSQFSVPTSGSAIFNNATDVQNIFGRVTGNQVSNINGILKTQGSASLFLMNPNGIVFGPNAQLQLGGSFLGTTASSIKFADEIEFNTVNATPELLSVKVPIGLQMGRNSGRITVQGLGHQLFISKPFIPFEQRDPSVGLKVGAGQSLGLIGGGVDLSGGILSTNGGGHLEIGSVGEGQINLSPAGLGWRGDYSAVQQFSDIHLARQSLIDASGSRGSILLQGKQINLMDGSITLIQNTDSAQSGDISIHATDALTLTGNTPDGRLETTIQIDNLGPGRSGDINITAAQINLNQGASITNRTVSPAAGGNITANVSGAILIDGFTPANPGAISSIATRTASDKNAGDVSIVADRLKITNGGTLSSLTFNSGQAGTLRVNIKDTIEVAGNNPITLTPSTLLSTSFGTGNARDVWINTAKLVVREGGVIGSSTYVSGAAGNVIINASQSLDLQGRANRSITASRIASTAEILDPATQDIYRLPRIPGGDAGSLTINTPMLRITDGADVTVKNDGPGKAGNLEIKSRSVFLNHQGTITASTVSGNGGDIRLNVQDSLLLRHGSKISATAGGRGSGGNLSIHAPIVLGLEDSDIKARAFQGQGGRITLTTQSVFGLQYRDRLTADSDITASSEFGINGNVSINIIGINPANALNTLPIDIVDSSTQIADRCGAAKTSSFIATGRGGMPQSPAQRKKSDRPWNDLRSNSLQASAPVNSIAEKHSQPIVEASAIQLDALGTIALVAPSPIERPSAATCGMGDRD